MDWFAPIDLYCERTAPGLLNEPLNATSNLAFFLAAALATRAAARDPNARHDGFLWLLIALVYLIGAGSTAFHTFANRWSLIADVAPITAFIYAFFLYAMRRFVGVSWLAAILATAAFFAASWAFAAAVPSGTLNGSVAYLPAFAGLVGLGAYLFSQAFPAGRFLIAAAAVFLVSLTARTIDLMVCTCLPSGTHWAWHALNAIVLFLALRSALRYGRSPHERSGAEGGRRDMRDDRARR
jgi:hypothetical protein